MMKFARIGATALALALSITFLTPSTVLAAPETKQELHRNSENEDSSSVIETNSKDVLGPYESYFDAQDAAEAKGYYKNDDWVDGYIAYRNESREWYVKYTTYTNIITGKTSTKEADVNSRFSPDSDDYYKFQSAIRIKKGEITYLAIPLKNGDTTIKKVKSSKKSIFTAKLYKKMSDEYTTKDSANWNSTKNSDGTYTYFYYNSVGDKVIIGTFADDAAGRAKREEALKATNGSYACRYIKLEGKSEGKANLKFRVYNADGKETGKVKIKIHVQADTSPFATVTFAGKSLLSDYSNSNNLNANKKETDTLWDVSSVKKGKLVVKANKNFKIKKIEVGTLYKETKSYEKPASGSYTTTKHEVDGKDVTFKYKKVKSGKKITLGTTPYYDDDENYSADHYASKSNWSNGDDSRKLNVSGMYAPTTIRVTYYDKLSKVYGQKIFTIYYKAKK